MADVSPTLSSPRRVIGLTGGIGMGKSTVSDYLATVHHLPILDADLLARDAVSVGSPILARIAQRYGVDLLHADGTLHRAQLAHIVFNDPAERRWLDQQIHPYVRDRLSTALAQALHEPVIVLAIPLLFEAQMTDLVTEIWVVTCTAEQQIERLLRRAMPVGADSQQTYTLTRDQAQARIQAQMDIQKKIAQADWVLDNSGTVATLHQHIDQALGPR